MFKQRSTSSKFLRNLVLSLVLMLTLINSGCDEGALILPGDEAAPADPAVESSPTPALASPTPAAEDILRNVNNEAMLNQAQNLAAFTITESWYVTTIRTIHWNAGQGAAPGQISLKDKTGKVYGPWQARGEAVSDVQNVRWVVEPKITLPPGSYVVIDSDPATWSTNEQAGLIGFVLVAGTRGEGSPKVEITLPPQKITPQTATEATLLPLTPSANTPVKADGKTVSDSAGVSVTVPMGTSSSGLKLIASQPPADFDQELQQAGLTRKSAFYKIEVDGQGASLPDGVITFPSSDPGERIVKLVDGRGLVWADEQVAGGKRAVHAFIGQPGAQISQYFLIAGAKTTRSLPFDPPANGPTSLIGYHRTGSTAPLQAAIENCSLTQTFRERGLKYTSRLYSCRRIPAYHIEISTNLIPLETWDANPAKVDVVLNKFQKYIDAYTGVGFTKADPAAGRPLDIRIMLEKASPYYNPLSGLIYLSWGDVLNDTTTPQLEQIIAHELFHWVENGSYTMANPAMEPETLWWLDVAAEVATFVINDQNVGYELLNFGQTSNGGAENKIGWQEPPFNWIGGVVNKLTGRAEEARYIHALQYYQQMKRNINATTDCFTGVNGFVYDINKAIVPVSDAKIKTIFRAGNRFLAQYLLNKQAPTACNLLPGEDKLKMNLLSTGRGYGDFIHASALNNSMNEQGAITLTKENFTYDGRGGFSIHATIPAGGLYPLRLSNGADLPQDNPDWDTKTFANLKMPSAPYVLTIQPSAPFWIKVGSNEVEEYVTLKEALDISPISSGKVTLYTRDANGNMVAEEKAGIPVVRLVAYNSSSQPVTFNATFQPAYMELVFNPARLASPAQKPSQTINVKLVNLLPLVTEPVEFEFIIHTTDDKQEALPKIKIAPKNGIAELNQKLTFSNPNVQEVFVNVSYTLGKQQKRLSGVIALDSTPVGNVVRADFRINLAHSTGTGLLFGEVDLNCPVKMTGANTFEYIPSSQCSESSDPLAESNLTHIVMKGQFVGQGQPLGQALNLQISFITPNGIGETVKECPISVTLINIPFSKIVGDAAAQYAIFNFTNGAKPNAAEVSAHLTKFQGITIKDSRSLVSNCGGLDPGVDVMTVNVNLTLQ